METLLIPRGVIGSIPLERMNRLRTNWKLNDGDRNFLNWRAIINLDPVKDGSLIHGILNSDLKADVYYQTFNAPKDCIWVLQVREISAPSKAIFVQVSHHSRAYNIRPRFFIERFSEGKTIFSQKTEFYQDFVAATSHSL